MEFCLHWDSLKPPAYVSGWNTSREKHIKAKNIRSRALLNKSPYLICMLKERLQHVYLSVFVCVSLFLCILFLYATVSGNTIPKAARVEPHRLLSHGFRSDPDVKKFSVYLIRFQPNNCTNLARNNQHLLFGVLYPSVFLCVCVCVYVCVYVSVCVYYHFTC